MLVILIVLIGVIYLSIKNPKFKEFNYKYSGYLLLLFVCLGLHSFALKMIDGGRIGSLPGAGWFTLFVYYSFIYQYAKKGGFRTRKNKKAWFLWTDSLCIPLAYMFHIVMIKTGLLNTKNESIHFFIFIGLVMLFWSLLFHFTTFLQYKFALPKYSFKKLILPVSVGIMFIIFDPDTPLQSIINTQQNVEAKPNIEQIFNQNTSPEGLLDYQHKASTSSIEEVEFASEAKKSNKTIIESDEPEITFVQEKEHNTSLRQMSILENLYTTSRKNSTNEQYLQKGGDNYQLKLISTASLSSILSNSQSCLDYSIIWQSQDYEPNVNISYEIVDYHKIKISIEQGTWSKPTSLIYEFKCENEQCLIDDVIAQSRSFKNSGMIC